ncbi:MAG TPA: tripartite tricarboxylate transporter substrate binding protein [Noviherbaspirillum sp.]|nr:tripartite tricarboxylate transporter substrate binding protein [Noviherbaspirillum sp.]
MKKLTCLLALGLFSAATIAGPFDKTECIAGAKPGGGFDLTCKLAQTALLETQVIKDPMRVTYMPGGIGAVAYNAVVGQRSGEPNTIVAFSGGSLLNIAQGKFGKYTENDVRWLAVIGADYGVVAVRKDSPYKTLKDLAEALKADPAKVVFGAGGTIGSQDWMKAALTAKIAGVSHKTMRFVAFEGGGEALSALQGGHVHVFAGDAAELAAQVKAGAYVRLLAVLSEKRLPGVLADVPTAKEQGFDVEWPIVRGFYMGPKVSDADFNAWTEGFNRMMRMPEFAKLREERGMYPFSMTGEMLNLYIKRYTQQYRKLAAEFGLVGEK